MEKSMRYMIKNTPIKEIGMVSTGINVVLQSLRNKNMMVTTRMNATKIVCWTSLIEFLMYLVESKPISKRTSSGRSFLINSNLR